MLTTRRHKPEVEGERFDTVAQSRCVDAGWRLDAADALIASLDKARVDEAWPARQHRLHAS